MMKKSGILLLLVAVLVLAGCSGGAAPTPTVDGEAIIKAAAATAFAHLTETKAAAPPTPTETPTATFIPPTLTPTIMPTIEPMIAVLRNASNLRSGPGKGGNERVGGLLFNQQVKVIGRNVGGNWLWVIFPDAPGGTAWILAAAVDLRGDLTHLPIVLWSGDISTSIVLPPIIYEVSGQPLPINTPAPGAKTASITQPALVRVGPSIGYSSIGTVAGGTTVTVTGRTSDNSWIQIEYPSGIDGRGWVSADLVHMNVEFAGLQFFNFVGTPISDEDANRGADQGIVVPTQDPNATPEPTSTPEAAPAGPTGVLYKASEVNVRSGPASSFALLGSLHTTDTVVITGMTVNGLWYRIVYPSGPDGYGWVSTKYIRVTSGDMSKLPILDSLGTPLPANP